jgi:hypothetical protein
MTSFLLGIREFTRGRLSITKSLYPRIEGFGHHGD